MRPADLAGRVVLLARRQPARTAAVLVACVAFAVYALTAVPGVSFADWAEAQAAPYLLGIMHPTGYPTYTLLGKLASLVPLGSVAWRANVSSAACVAVALATATLIMTRLGVRPLVAGSLALAAGFTADIWLNATHAEVHTLHLLLVALLIHRLLIWADEGRPRDLYLGALLLGLAFGNHLLTLTVAPFIVAGALWLGWRTIRARPLVLAGAGLEFLLGLAVYLYLPLRSLDHPPFMYADLSNWNVLLAHVSGQEFRNKMAFLSADGAARFAQQLAQWLAPPQGPILLAVLAGALVGALVLLRRRTAFALVLLGLLLANLYITSTYDPARQDQYLFASILIVALFLGVAAEAALAALAPRRRWAAALVALVPLVLLLTTWSAVDQSGNHDGDRFVDTVLADLPANAALYTYWDAATPLRYAQLVEGRRPDVAVITDSRQIAGLVAAGRTVYALQMFEGLVNPLRATYRLTPIAEIGLPYGDITAPYPRSLWRLDAIGDGG